MGIGSLGITEMAVIFVIALVVFGPKRLPELGRSLGSAMREFRRSLNEIQRELEDADPVRPVKDEVNSILGPLKGGAKTADSRAATDPPAAPPAPPPDPPIHPERTGSD
jgi:TatA/E family protein of Tat protein translocase